MSKPGYRISIDDFASMLARDPALEHYRFGRKVTDEDGKINELPETQWCYANCRGKFVVELGVSRGEPTDGPYIYFFFLDHYDAIHFRLAFDLDFYPNQK